MKVAMMLMLAVMLAAVAQAAPSLCTAPSDYVVVPSASTSGNDSATLLLTRVGDPFDSGDSDDFLTASVGFGDAEVFVSGNVDTLNLNDLSFGAKYAVCKDSTPLSVFLYNVGDGSTAVPGFVFDPKVPGLPVNFSVAGWYNHGWETGAAAAYRVLPYTSAVLEYSTSDKLICGLQANGKILRGRVMWLDQDNDWLVEIGGTLGW